MLESAAASRGRRGGLYSFLCSSFRSALIWSAAWSPQAWYGHGEFFAPNPEFDGVITYYLRDAASGPVSVEIGDAGGIVRTLKGSSAKGPGA